MTNESTFIVSGVTVSLYRRKPGGKLYYYFRANNTRHRNTTKVYNERDARAVVRPLVLAALEGKSESPFVALPLSEILKAYYEERWPEAMPEATEKAPRRGSYSAAKSTLSKFAEIIGADSRFVAMSFSEACAAVHKYIDQRKVQLNLKSPDRNHGLTLNSERLRISKLCSWLMARQHTTHWPSNPAASQRIEIPPTVTEDPEPLDEIETDMIVTGGRTREVWPIIVLCLGCGTRPAEAIRVEWSDVDFQRHIIAVTNRKLKRTRPRYPVMNTWVELELKEWLANNPADRVWPFNEYVAFDQMARLRDELGLPPHVTLQGLRQTACTRAIAAGMKLQDYVLQFGHSLAIAQKHYLKFGKFELADRRDQMEKLTFGFVDTLGTK